MKFQLVKLFTNLYIVLIIFNDNLASGKKKKSKSTADDGDIDVWLPKSITQEIKFLGTLRESFAMRVALMAPNKNTVCSPISALLPLGKLVLGAKGKTRNELLKTLGYAKTEIRPILKKYIASLKNLPGVTLNMVSKMFIPQHTMLNETFHNRSMDIFHSSAEHVDYAHPENMVQIINKEVKEHTNGMIPNLLYTWDIAPEASILVVNAIYFQGGWRKHFEKAKPSKFISPVGTRTVPMMSVTSSFNYGQYEPLNIEIVEIPFDGNNASFIIVLPKDTNGLPMLLTALKLAPQLLNKAMRNMELTSVEVSMPKFKISTKINLIDVYEQIGISTLFRPGVADLSKMVTNEQVYVSSAIQDAMIEVSETGNQSPTSATTLTFNGEGGTVKFKADHPFLYYVLVNDEQLMVGTYNCN